MHSIDETIVPFSKIGLKKTKARSAIFHILREEKRPLDVVEIKNYLKQHNITVDRATVYRMLETFLEKDIIYRLEFGEGKYRYELAGSDHHHLVCENCGRVEDISDCGIEEGEKKIKQKKHFLVKHHSLEFFGICKSCQQ